MAAPPRPAHRLTAGRQGRLHPRHDRPRPAAEGAPAQPGPPASRRAVPRPPGRRRRRHHPVGPRVPGLGPRADGAHLRQQPPRGGRHPRPHRRRPGPGASASSCRWWPAAGRRCGTPGSAASESCPPGPLGLLQPRSPRFVEPRRGPRPRPGAALRPARLPHRPRRAAGTTRFLAGLAGGTRGSVSFTMSSSSTGSPPRTTMSPSTPSPPPPACTRGEGAPMIFELAHLPPAPRPEARLRAPVPPGPPFHEQVRRHLRRRLGDRPRRRVRVDARLPQPQGAGTRRSTPTTAAPSGCASSTTCGP